MKLIQTKSDGLKPHPWSLHPAEPMMLIKILFLINGFLNNFNVTQILAKPQQNTHSRRN
jgi:hypothetical protein